MYNWIHFIVVWMNCVSPMIFLTLKLDGYMNCWPCGDIIIRCILSVSSWYLSRALYAKWRNNLGGTTTREGNYVKLYIIDHLYLFPIPQSRGNESNDTIPSDLNFGWTEEAGWWCATRFFHLNFAGKLSVIVELSRVARWMVIDNRMGITGSRTVEEERNWERKGVRVRMDWEWEDDNSF